MKLAIVHLSDLHFKNNDNLIHHRADLITQAIKSIMYDIQHLHIVITGDIAYSGKQTEYLEALGFLEKLTTSLSEYQLDTITVPGNHDCDFNINSSVRDIIINNLQAKLNSIDCAIITQCCEPQKSYFTFADCVTINSYLHSSLLLKIAEKPIGSHKIRYSCYNTSWMSSIKEKPGSLTFPIEEYPGNLQTTCDLNIAVMHHNLYWYNPTNRRELESHFEKIHDLILTGHEHVTTSKVIENVDIKTEYIEGGVLQESSDSSSSAFNVILVDLKQRVHILHQFKLDGNIYKNMSKKPDWAPLATKKSDRYSFTTDFMDFLNNPGASYMHPKKNTLTLDDIFVKPNLKNLKVDRTKEALDIVQNSEILFTAPNRNGSKILLIGAEKSGKTTLCKTLIRYYHANTMLPIYIEGNKISNSSIDEFNKLLLKTLREEYCTDEVDAFVQLDNKNKVIIIDDFDKSRLNLKYNAVFIDNLLKHYPNVILTASDLFQIEEVVYDESTKNRIYEEFDQYQLLEFGHLLRSKLINKWYLVGSEEILEETDLVHKHDLAKKIIDTIIGKNLVPAYPIFLLVILQSIEAGTPHSLQESSYGYYYQYLITRALGKTKSRNDDLDAYFNYITELAYHFFRTQKREICKEELMKFHQWYVDEYDINSTVDEKLSSLVDADILQLKSGCFRFKYLYTYYFFTAKYLANTITEPSTKTIISEMCKRLYREEFANIIMFLTHHSKDPFILEEVLDNAKLLFSENEPVKFEKDIEKVNTLLKEIPKLIIKEKDYKANRDEEYERIDQVKFSNEKEHSPTTLPHYEEEVVNLDLASRINLSLKTIEIIGQIVRNYYGSLKADKKQMLGEETYLVGLRTLNNFFITLDEHTDSIINDIQGFLQRGSIVEKDRVEEISKRLIFGLCVMITFSFIRRISGAIGSEKLSDTLSKIIDKYNFNSTHLIDISIKLDYFKAFPFSDINNLKDKFRDNPLSLSVLRKMVIHHLYMFPISFQDRQRICSSLGISMETQRAIEAKSSQRKV